MANIDLEGIDELKMKLAFMQDPRGVAGGLKDAAVHLKGIAAQYPAYKLVTMKQVGGWKSDKQRKYVMAKIREGSITPGKSRRSGNHAKRWAINTKALSASVSNNNGKYGQYLQGSQQSRMHDLIGWKTVEKIAEEQSEAVVKILMRAIEKVLNR